MTPDLVELGSAEIFAMERYFDAAVRRGTYAARGESGFVVVTGEDGQQRFVKHNDATPGDWAAIRAHRIKRKARIARERAAKPPRPPKQLAFDSSTPADHMSRHAARWPSADPLTRTNDMTKIVWTEKTWNPFKALVPGSPASTGWSSSARVASREACRAFSISPAHDVLRQYRDAGTSRSGSKPD